MFKLVAIIRLESDVFDNPMLKHSWDWQTRASRTKNWLARESHKGDRWAFRENNFLGVFFHVFTNYSIYSANLLVLWRFIESRISTLEHLASNMTLWKYTQLLDSALFGILCLVLRQLHAASVRAIRGYQHCEPWKNAHGSSGWLIIDYLLVILLLYIM